MMGIQRALIDVRRRILDDEKPGRLAADVCRLGKRAFALLEKGLGDYAPRPAAVPRGVRAQAAKALDGLGRGLTE